MVEMAMFNVQRAITPNVSKPELWLICRLVELYICVKFRENERFSTYRADTSTW